MELSFKLDNGYIFSDTCSVLLLEVWVRPSSFLNEVLTNKQKFVFNKVIEECIHVYDFLGEAKRKVFIINIGEVNDLSNYFFFINYVIEKTSHLFKHHLSIYLGDTNNFFDLAEAAAKFCELNMHLRLKLRFWSSESNIKTLDDSLKNLTLRLKQREDEISTYILDSLKCKRCKIFSYEPSLFPCCSCIICSKCSRYNLCPLCGKTIQPINEGLALQSLTRACPYTCRCGEKMSFSSRNEHSKVCLQQLYKCNICNLSLSYQGFFQHLKLNHYKYLEEQNLF